MCILNLHFLMCREKQRSRILALHWSVIYITCMHLADTFIQTNLHCIQVINLSVHAFPGIQTLAIIAENCVNYSNAV